MTIITRLRRKHGLPAMEECGCPPNPAHRRWASEGGLELRRVTPYRWCHRLLPVGLRVQRPVKKIGIGKTKKI